MPTTILHLNDEQMKLLGYALIFFITNIDEDIEEDLEMGEQQIRDALVETGLVRYE